MKEGGRGNEEGRKEGEMGKEEGEKRGMWNEEGRKERRGKMRWKWWIRVEERI